MKSVQKYYEESDKELSRRYLNDCYPELTPEFFLATREHRYSLYPTLPQIAGFQSWREKDVLEVGVGHGTDHAMFAEAGARVCGIDLTGKHCTVTKRCLESFMQRPKVVQANVLQLPFRSHTFDHVYSCGVLLLFPDIAQALSEIHRVLKPSGSTIIMLYNKASLHYWLKTRLYYGWVLGEDNVLGKDTVNDWYTDGINYPKVYYYQPREIQKLFGEFSKTEYRTTCLTPEQIPLIGLPRDYRMRTWIESKFGFFLWIRAWA